MLTLKPALFVLQEAKIANDLSMISQKAEQDASQHSVSGRWHANNFEMMTSNLAKQTPPPPPLGHVLCLHCRCTQRI